MNSKNHQSHQFEILMMIRYGENCRNQVEMTNLFSSVSKVHAQFRELRDVRPVKRTPHFVEDDVKADYFVNWRREYNFVCMSNASLILIYFCARANKIELWRWIEVRIALGTSSFSNETTFTVNQEVNRFL